MMIRSLTVVLLAVVWSGVSGADPPKCCTERQFEARLAEVGGSLYKHNGQQVPALINGLRYVIEMNKCTYVRGSRAISEQCVPDNAKFLGRSYFGYGVNSVPANNWQYTSPSNNVSIKSSMAASNCVPFVQAAFSTLGQDASNDVVFIVTGFRPGIQRPSVFDIPADCVPLPRADNQIPSEHIKRGARYIDAVLSR
ncbi:ependymin-related protein 2-like isoform X2 [Haliotis rufescens]|uniref:ependymin-related protein 2-like isoform X2 n=1 Tax=Haliotis rufescens TaxID=6454 RepID=UPI001EB07854|nr:ependymin-related protein 2-like isoform X2 [Haliotis rufescens]